MLQGRFKARLMRPQLAPVRGHGDGIDAELELIGAGRRGGLQRGHLGAEVQLRLLDDPHRQHKRRREYRARHVANGATHPIRNLHNEPRGLPMDERQGEL